MLESDISTSDYSSDVDSDIIAQQKTVSGRASAKRQRTDDNESDFSGYGSGDAGDARALADTWDGMDALSDVSENEDTSPALGENPVDHPEWSRAVTIHDPFPFTGITGFQQDIPEDVAPNYFFWQLFSDDLLDHIRDCTNAYADFVLQSDRFRQSREKKYSRIKSWKRTTTNELKTFILLSIHMGSVHLPEIRLYWCKSSNQLYHQPFFARGPMSYRRYRMISSMLHLSLDFSVGGPDRLAKIRPFLEQWLRQLREFYYPTRELSLDEAMVPYRGRFIGRQYIKNKAHKYGLKLYELCEPDGLCVNLMVYTGSRDIQIVGSHTEGVVLRLMEPFLDKGHRLYMDSYYNSVKLSRTLYARKTHVTGTLRPNRIGNPKEVTQQRLERGDSFAMTSGPVVVTKWKDKRDVLTISPEVHHEMIPVKTSTGKIQKPFSVTVYNDNMSGIDKMDQMISYYGDTRKAVKWYKKLFLHLLEMTVFNGYSLYIRNRGAKDMTFLQYRNSLVQKLCIIRPSQSASKRTIPVTDEHYLEDIPIPEPAGPAASTAGHQRGIRKRRRCAQCYKMGMRKDVTTRCALCPDHPALCSRGTCSKDWHADNVPQ